jgi:glutaconyl-CoA decarboxylase
MRRYTLDINGTDFVVDVQELDADLFEVTVADQIYQVALGGDEAVAGAAPAAPAPRPAAAPAAPRPAAAAAPAPAAAAAPAAPRKAPKGGGANMLTAPMPGTIVEVSVKVGEKVERGQKVAVLDAMKMHNVIGATKAGTIAEIYVTDGQSVNHGDAIARFAD